MVPVYNFDACILGIRYGRRVVDWGIGPVFSPVDRCGGEGRTLGVGTGHVQPPLFVA